MSTLSDRSGQALLVIDVQAGVIDGGFERDRVVDNIGALVDTARAADVPIVWIQHNEPEMPVGSDWWQIVPELTPRPDEARVDKQYRSSFEGTDLEQVLEALGVASLVVCGAQTNYCVRHTVHAALERGYDVTLVSDAHTTSDQPGDHGTVSAASIIDEQNASCSSYDLPGRRCELTTAATAGEALAGAPGASGLSTARQGLVEIVQVEDHVAAASSGAPACRSAGAVAPPPTCAIQLLGLASGVG